jgi:hypothetical protein
VIAAESSIGGGSGNVALFWSFGSNKPQQLSANRDVVIDEFLEGASKVALAEWHHPIEALALDGPHEPFGIGVRIRRLKWRLRLHDVHPGIPQQLSHVPAPLSVTITNQHAMGAP